MFLYQVIAISLLSLAYSFSLLLFFGRFKKEKTFSLLLIIPITVFSLGYVLRLTGSKPIVDVGFFLGDIILGTIQGAIIGVILGIVAEILGAIGDKLQKH